MGLSPGTPVEGSPDPRTVEQNRTLQTLQCVNRNSEIGGQYAGMVLYPDGTLTADRSQVRYNADWQAAYYKTVFEARGKPSNLPPPNDKSGGYIVSLGVDGVPNQVIGCSSQYEQTNEERAQLLAYAKSGGGDVSAGMQNGMTREAAADLARQGMPVAAPSSNPIAAQPAPVPEVPIKPFTPRIAPQAAPVATLGSSGGASVSAGGSDAATGADAGKAAAGAAALAEAAKASPTTPAAAAAGAGATAKSKISDIPWWGWLLLFLGLTSGNETHRE